MLTEQEQARKIAERVAKSVSANASASKTPTPSVNLSAELSSVRASLSDLQEKLAQIEAKVSSQGSNYSSPATANPTQPEHPTLTTHSPWLAGLNAFAHPSQEKFGIEEAVVSELVDFFEKEKTCSVEPGGKPCDHCDMCSSRGF